MSRLLEIRNLAEGFVMRVVLMVMGFESAGVVFVLLPRRWNLRRLRVPRRRLHSVLDFFASASFFVRARVCFLSLHLVAEVAGFRSALDCCLY